jgi:uncharacterized protein YndB with AHSA1/START domain
VKKLRYSVHVAAPVETVWRTMLAPDTYRAWSSAFCEGSTFEGSWAQGETIRFLTPDGEGMFGRIAENRRHEYLSIQLLGCIHGGVEDTTSEQARAWQPGRENYAFHAADGGTHLEIELDTTAEFEPYLQEAWPKALARLKAICEARGA